MGFINQRSHHWGAPSCRQLVTILVAFFEVTSCLQLPASAASASTLGRLVGHRPGDGGPGWCGWKWCLEMAGDIMGLSLYGM